MLNPRLNGLPDNPFDRLRALMDSIKPKDGLEPITLSIGEPRHAPPALIADAFKKNAHLWGRYPPGDGTPEFRRAVTHWLRRRYRLNEGDLNPDKHVLPAVGTREALYLISALVVPERKSGRRPHVVMPNPFYHVYGAATAVSGADPVYLSATPETRFLPDVTRLDSDTLQRTALYYFCSPANPQGAVANFEELKIAIETAREYDFVLVVDECYAEIYDSDPPPGALEACRMLGDGFKNVLVFHSLSKRSSAPGLRSGFVAGDETLINAFRRLRNYVGPQMPMPAMAASAALWDEETHVEENRCRYREKFDIAEELLGERFEFYRPAGGFFVWLNVGDGEAATAHLWREVALRVLPGGFIGRPDVTRTNPGHRYIRVALVDDLETTHEALQRLVQAL